MKTLRIITAQRRVTEGQLWSWIYAQDIAILEDACCCPYSLEYAFKFAKAIDIAEAQKFETEFLAWLGTV